MSDAASLPNLALPEGVQLRGEAQPGDPERIRALTAATGFFSPVEIDIAVELVEERLARGVASGYELLFAEREEELLGYSCFGPIPLTTGSWDLYWIAVQPGRQGRGLGRALLAASEEEIRRTGGRRVWVDTSSRPQYEPTRAFYQRCGYRQAALLADFYAPGDGKVIFLKVL